MLYFGLFALATQLTGSMLPNTAFYYRGLGRLWPMREITLWTAGHVFGVSPALEEITTAGEPLFFWVQTFWILCAAVAGTAIWSYIDRRRREYATAHGWFRLFVRFVLAAALFEYGMTKIIPTQFPAPSLTTLVTPAGDLTLSGLLWASIGASPAYEIFTGCVEVLGAILLVIPRTTLLGGFVCLAAATQIFVLNMTFDVGLKLISFHLVLLALFLIAPDAPRLAAVFVGARAVPARSEPPLLGSPRARRALLIAQLLFGAYLLGMYTFINIRFWEVGGGGRPRSPLYGIWNIEQMAVDGTTRPSVQNDYDRRWRRLIFEDPDKAVFQRTDDSLAHYNAAIDTAARTFDLTRGGGRRWRAHFIYEQPSPDRLIVNGDMDGHQLELRLHRVDFDTFRLLNSDFRWVRSHDLQQ